MNGQNNQNPFNFPSTKAGSDDLKIQIPNVDISPFVGGSFQVTDMGAAYLSPRFYSPQDSPLSSPEMAFSNMSPFNDHSERSNEDVHNNSFVKAIVKDIFDDDEDDHYHHDHGLLPSRALQRSAHPSPMAASSSGFYNPPSNLNFPGLAINQNRSSLSGCVIHPNEAIMYCYSCRATVCNMCQTNNHHSHHLTSELATASEAAKKQSGRILDEIEGYISIQENMIKNLKSANDSGSQVYNPDENNLANLKQMLCTVIEQGNNLEANPDEMKAMKQLLSRYQEEVLRRTISQLYKVAQEIFDSKDNLRISGNPENLIAVNENAYNKISKIKNEYLEHTQFEELWLSTFRSIDGSNHQNRAIGGERALRIRNNSPYLDEARQPEYKHNYYQRELQQLFFYQQQQLQQERQKQQYYRQPQQQQLQLCQQRHQQPQRQLQQLLQQSQQQQQQLQLYQQPPQQQLQKYQDQIQLPRPNPLRITLQYYTGSLAPQGIVLSRKIVKTDQSPSPAPVLIIGDRDDRNSFCRPWGVACDKDGNIIVADRSNNEIKIYDQNGNFVRNFGSRGSGPGQFDRPAGIVVDNRNRVIVVDKDNHRIQIVTKYGDYLLAFGEKGMMNGQFNYPWDVAVNSRCEILVSDTRNHRVQLFSAEGEFLRKFGYETAQHMWRLLDLPRSVSFAPNGEILVSDFNNHHIIVLDDKLRNARVFGPARRRAPFLRIQGMKVDDAGNVVVADSRNNRIQVLGPDGNLKFIIGNQGNDVGQDGVNQNGLRQNGVRQNVLYQIGVYQNGVHQNGVRQYGVYQNGVRQNGVHQNGVGQNGVDQNDVNQMDRPAGIAISPDGKIIIVDFGNNRVLVY